VLAFGPAVDLALLSDEAILALVSRGDEAALGALYDRFGRPAYRLALRVLRDPGLAEDAVQDAFLTVWRTATGFRPERARASTWVLTLVHRRAVDVVRREERRRADPIDETYDPAADNRTDDEAAAREQRRRVQAALVRLSPDQREALELAYYGGLSQSEIAERLNVPLGTIKSRMFSGLARLRDLLGDSVIERG
jgi:RNA polymerase sigma-70 factor (ECF subfamily)